MRQYLGFRGENLGNFLSLITDQAKATPFSGLIQAYFLCGLRQGYSTKNSACSGCNISCLCFVLMSLISSQKTLGYAFLTPLTANLHMVLSLPGGFASTDPPMGPQISGS